ncbi:hypothetical protein ACOME3_007795 [Neoechinorhynchus agilis]
MVLLEKLQEPMRRRRRSNQTPWYIRRHRQSMGNRSSTVKCFGWKTSPKRKIRLWLGLADLVAILCTLLFFGLIYLLAAPFKQGFFCDDSSIFKPYKPNTVEMWHLGLYGVIGPLILFLFVELWVTHPYGKDSRKRRQAYGISVLHTWFLFLLGIAATFLMVEVGKRSFGRLRPHFIQVCQPDWSRIHCYDMIKTVKVSQCHRGFVCTYVRFLKPILQCAFICIAFFTCLSRITDNMHHPTDVLGGALIGATVAGLVVIRVGHILWTYGIYGNHQDPWLRHISIRTTGDFTNTISSLVDQPVPPQYETDLAGVKPQSLVQKHQTNQASIEQDGGPFERNDSTYEFTNRSSYEQPQVTIAL